MLSIDKTKTVETRWLFECDFPSDGSVLDSVSKSILDLRDVGCTQIEIIRLKEGFGILGVR